MEHSVHCRSCNSTVRTYDKIFALRILLLSVSSVDIVAVLTTNKWHCHHPRSGAPPTVLRTRAVEVASYKSLVVYFSRSEVDCGEMPWHGGIALIRATIRSQAVHYVVEVSMSAFLIMYYYCKSCWRMSFRVSVCNIFRSTSTS